MGSYQKQSSRSSPLRPNPAVQGRYAIKLRSAPDLERLSVCFPRLSRSAQSTERKPHPSTSGLGLLSAPRSQCADLPSPLTRRARKVRRGEVRSRCPTATAFGRQVLSGAEHRKVSRRLATGPAGRVSLGTFLPCNKKVPRPPGRDPANLKFVWIPAFAGMTRHQSRRW